MEIKIPGFSGSITVKQLKYLERVNYISAGQDIYSQEIPTGQKNLKIMELTCEEAKKIITNFKLVHEKTGREFNSLEELEPYREYNAVIDELAKYMREGEELGND